MLVSSQLRQTNDNLYGNDDNATRYKIQDTRYKIQDTRYKIRNQPFISFYGDGVDDFLFIDDDDDEPLWH